MSKGILVRSMAKLLRVLTLGMVIGRMHYMVAPGRVLSGLNRNEQLVKFFVQACPQRLGRTQLVKLLYLADFEACRYLGAQLSRFEWTREPQGPFDRAFYDAKDSLVELQAIFEAGDVTPFGNPWYQYRDNPEVTVRFDFSPAERRILEHIVTTYGSRSREEIIQDVYLTPPFVAVEDSPRHTRLPMELVTGQKKAEFGGVDLEALIAAEQRRARGEGVPWQVYRKQLLEGVDG